jgi:hypothetical protein
LPLNLDGTRQRVVSIGNVNQSQANVSKVRGDGTPIENVTKNKTEGGRDPNAPDADMVANEDGTMSSIDDRRLVAADGVGDIATAQYLEPARTAGGVEAARRLAVRATE